jgi:hypothetical protein
MMRNSWQKFWFPAAQVVLLAVAASIAASGVGVPPGAYVSDYLLLGGKETSLSIDIDPAGAAMHLHQDEIATAGDSIVITADGAWKLTVEDTNAVTSSCDGKMRKGSLSGEPLGWNYDNPDNPMTDNFKVLVEDIGDNDELPETVKLNDCDDLSSSETIVTSSATSSSLSVDLMYSQRAVEGYAAGAYRIDLTYTLSSNP